MAVQLIMMSPHTKHQGLFRAAILQSGPILSAFAHSDKHPAFYCRTFANAVGCDPSSSGPDLLACLQSLPVEELVRHVRLFDHEDQVMHNAPSPWKPIQDGLFLHEKDAFLPKDPLDLLEAGEFSDVPVITGHTSDEGLYAVTEVLARNPKAADIIFQDWENRKGPSYIFGREEDETDAAEVELAGKFLDRFLEGGRSREPLVLQNMFSHSVWTAASLRTAKLLARGKTAATFQYHYTHPGRLSLADIFSSPLWKLILKVLAAKVNVDVFHNSWSAATHFDEIFLLFKGQEIPFLQRHSPEDRAVSEMLLRLWTSFAKTGVPEVPEGAATHAREWQPLQPNGDPVFLEIGTAGAQMRNYSAFAEVTEFFEQVWSVVPPRLHLSRSRTWRQPELYGEVPYRALPSLPSSSPYMSSSASSISSEL